jgi:hypothetical protein
MSRRRRGHTRSPTFSAGGSEEYAEEIVGPAGVERFLGGEGRVPLADGGEAVELVGPRVLKVGGEAGALTF